MAKEQRSEFGAFLKENPPPPKTWFDKLPADKHADLLQFRTEWQRGDYQEYSIRAIADYLQKKIGVDIRRSALGTWLKEK